MFSLFFESSELQGGAALRGKCYRLTLRVVTLPSGDVRRTT